MLFVRQYQPASSASGRDATQRDDERLRNAVQRGLERGWGTKVLTYPKQAMREGDSVVNRKELLERIIRQSFKVSNNIWPYHGDSLTAHPLDNEGGCMLVVGMVKSRGPVTVGLHIKMMMADGADNAEG